MKGFLANLKYSFRSDLLCIPFATTWARVYAGNQAYTIYTNVYLFGIRIAVFQAKEKP